MKKNIIIGILSLIIVFLGIFSFVKQTQLEEARIQLNATKAEALINRAEADRQKDMANMARMEAEHSAMEAQKAYNQNQKDK